MGKSTKKRRPQGHKAAKLRATSKKQLDLFRVKRYSLASRQSKVSHASLGKPVAGKLSFKRWLNGLPDVLAARDLRQIAAEIARCHRSGGQVLLGMGAHPIKVGLSPVIIDLIKRGVVTAVAMNGAGIIHDFEMAYAGHTSEEVGPGLENGSFGMARETSLFLNQAITKGHREGEGIGRAVGKSIAKGRFPYRRLSILAAAWKQATPVSVHVGIGTDIIHMHPEADGAAIGAASLKDFHLLTQVVAQLGRGVFINLGSAVIIPEVFLKALNLARNLGAVVRGITTVNMDFLRQYRPSVNVVERPCSRSGRGYHLTGHHEIMLPLLAAAVIEELHG